MSMTRGDGEQRRDEALSPWSSSGRESESPERHRQRPYLATRLADAGLGRAQSDPPNKSDAAHSRSDASACDTPPPPAPRVCNSSTRLTMSNPLASAHPDSLLFLPVPSSAAMPVAGERQPLLPASSDSPRKKPFYRPRPLWLVPFAITAAIVRGMTLAPRVEVFTQLSCNAAQHQHYNHTTINILSHHPPHNPYTSLYFSLDPLGPTLPLLSYNSSIAIPDWNNHTQGQNDDEDEDEEDPRTLPSDRCLSNPVVQAGAARLQTIMTITMGGLSAITTGWWGQFGERHGRTRVLAIATFGLFLTDLLFILVSTPHSPFATHGHKLLILAPFFEGLLGGWSTLQCATSAYLSDCTSSGSRANIFSRFTGVFSIGAALGPSFGAFLIRHPVLGVAPQSVTEVFWVAVACSFVNFVLVLFVFPESLSKEKQRNARDICSKGKARAPVTEIENIRAIDDAADAPANGGIMEGFFSPLAVFLPVIVNAPGGRRRRDWSLTFLAFALFGYMLSSGVVQIKYLYAGHVYTWGAEQLSDYISFLNGIRALHLLLFLPIIIATFKPILKSTQPKPKTKSTKPLTKVQLTREMDFDFRIASFSLLIDLASQGLIAISPLPTTTHDPTQPTYTPVPSDSGSQTVFVMSSALSSFGSGTIPAIQSFALCIAQLRALDTVHDEGTGAVGNGSVDIGRLFGALAVLQAIGQTILGPVLFGLVYSETVATYPKAIFVTATGIMVGALALMTLARPAAVGVKGKRKMKKWEREEAERGRSRVSKDLRGGSASLGLSRPTENSALVGPSRL